MTIDGQLPVVQAALFTVPSNKTARITSIEVVNVSGATRTQTLYINQTGTARAITPTSFSLIDGAKMEDIIVRTLKGGSKLEGISSGVNVMYVINVDLLP